MVLTARTLTKPPKHADRGKEAFEQQECRRDSKVTKMNNPHIVGISALVAIIAISAVSYVVIKVAQSAPKALVGTLLALAVVLSSVPAILYAVYGA